MVKCVWKLQRTQPFIFHHVIHVILFHVIVKLHIPYNQNWAKCFPKIFLEVWKKVVSISHKLFLISTKYFKETETHTLQLWTRKTTWCKHYQYYTLKYFTLAATEILKPATGEQLEMRTLWLLPGAGGCGRGTRHGAAAATRGWPGCSPSPPGARWSSAAAPRGGRWPDTPCTCSPSRPSLLGNSTPPGCGTGKTSSKDRSYANSSFLQSVLKQTALLF